MVNSHEIAIATGIAMLVGYPLGMRILAEKMQPSRLRMLEVGKQLLASASLPEEHKRAIASMLNDADNPAVMILIAITMPYYVILKITRHLKGPPRIEDAEAQRMYNEFCRRFVASIATANPIFTVVAALEMAILAIILFPLGQLSRTQDIQFGTIQTVDKTLQAFDPVLHRRAA